MFKFISVLFILLLQIHADAGVSVGNGSDQLTGYRNGWFLETQKVVNVCLDFGPNFYSDRVEIEELFKKSWSRWMDYIETADPLDSNELKSRFAYKTELTYCNFVMNYDLKIYLDTVDPLVESLKARYINPKAFSEKISNDIKSWSPGVIWIKPISLDLNKSNRRAQIFALLLHELGHVFGAPHIPNTIMDAGIADKVNSFSQLSDVKIDLKNQLFRKDNFLQISSPSQASNPSQSPPAQAFELMTGTQPENPFTIRLQKNMSQLVLHFKSGSIEKSFSLRNSGIIAKQQGPEIFVTSQPNAKKLWHAGDTTSYIGTSSSGQKYVFLHNFNLGDSVHQLILVDPVSNKNLIILQQ